VFKRDLDGPGGIGIAIHAPILNEWAHGRQSGCELP
jgi:hypothetical protein